MANRGFLSQVFNQLKKSIFSKQLPEQFVGHDMLGNRYFERKLENKKPQRRVEPRDKDITNVPEIPVEWMTWLQGRRLYPPSAEEIDKNVHTMLKTQARARELYESRKLEDGEGINISTNHTSKSNFPVYDDYEDIPGQSNEKKKS